MESSDPIFVQLLFLILHFPLSFKGSNRQLQVILIRNVRVCQVLFNLARRKTSQPVNDVLHMLFFNRLVVLHKTLLKIVLIIFTFLLRVKIWIFLITTIGTHKITFEIFNVDIFFEVLSITDLGDIDLLKVTLLKRMPFKSLLFLRSWEWGLHRAGVCLG